jgi:hypothetical protein
MSLPILDRNHRPFSPEYASAYRRGVALVDSPVIQQQNKILEMVEHQRRVTELTERVLARFESVIRNEIFSAQSKSDAFCMWMLLFENFDKRGVDIPLPEWLKEMAFWHLQDECAMRNEPPKRGRHSSKWTTGQDLLHKVQTYLIHDCVVYLRKEELLTVTGKSVEHVGNFLNIGANTVSDQCAHAKQYLSSVGDEEYFVFDAPIVKLFTHFGIN